MGAKRRKHRGALPSDHGGAERDVEWVRRRAALLDPEDPGHEREWRAVYAYTGLLRAKVGLRVRDDDVNAIMSDIWTTAFEKLDQVKSGRSLRGWLVAVADSAVDTHYRTTGRRANREETTDQLPDLPGPGWNTLDRMVGAERVARLMAGLSSHQRLVLIRYCTHGPRVRDVADELGTSIDAVYQALSRIRQRAHELKRAEDT